MKSKFIILLLAAMLMGLSMSAKEKPKTEYSAISDHFKPADTIIPSSASEEKKIDLPQFRVKPNVIIILADDLDAVYTPQFFSEVLPVVDSLKKAGIDFTNSFTPMSICCPSRSATLTGTYAHTNGVYRNASYNGGWKAFKHNEPYSLSALLSRSGYRTAMIGKYLNGYGSPNAQPVFGWTDGSVIVSKEMDVYRGYNYDLLNWTGGHSENDSLWKTSEADRKKFGDSAQDYSTDVLAAKALTYIQETEKKDDQPFFLYLTPTSPHLPLQPAPRYMQLAEKWINTFHSAEPNYFSDYGKLATPAERKKPLDKSSFLLSTWKKRVREQNKGAFFYNLYDLGKVPKPIKSFVQADWYSRMGSLYALNDMIRNLITKLKENGEWDHTLLIFTSDNGFMMGAHAMLHKGNPYEEALRVPLIIAGGDSLYMKSHKKSDEWVTNLDLMPTIFDMAGIKIPERVEGRSLIPFLYSDSVSNFRDCFVMEYLGPGMTTEALVKKPAFMMKMVPLYILDHPSYNAIRMKVITTENGVSKEQVFKYIEWQRNTSKKVLHFSDLFRNENPELLQKIAGGDPKTLALKSKAEEVETELYNISEDPYEMDNLLYYKPEEYKALALQLKTSMRAIILKKKH